VQDIAQSEGENPENEQT
jgi:hypothetical protein